MGEFFFGNYLFLIFFSVLTCVFSDQMNLSIIKDLCMFLYLSCSRVSGDPLSKLPVPHNLAILATVDEVSLIPLNVRKYNNTTHIYKKMPTLHFTVLYCTCKVSLHS